MKLKEIRKKYNSSQEFFQAVLDGCIQLAKEQPDFVYNPHPLKTPYCTYNGPCQYKDNYGETESLGPDCKGCIVGQSLQRLGLDDPEELGSTLSVRNLLLSVGPPFTNAYPSYDTLNKLSKIQSKQDKGVTWAEAVAPT
jgi:hypothetical protein